MGASQRRKGHDFERWVVRQMRRVFPGARRGLQYRDGADAPDVAGTPFHIECKRGRKPNPRAALEQAMGDAAKGAVPVAVVKDDFCQPFVVMTWADWLDLVGEWVDRTEG